MAKIFSERIVVSIDIGTTKICVLIAQLLDADTIEILGIGKSPSDGLKKGVVVDIHKTISSIKSAVKEAELMADVTINTAAIGISGGHIQSINSAGMVAIKHGQVKESDIASVMNAARAIAVPEGMQILHVLPQFFILDSRQRVHNPLDMHGVRLEVQAHIIMGAIASVQNLITCTQAAGVRVCDIILEQLASADAVLNAYEREIGVAMLDIGGGTSDLALYQAGNIRHTYVLPVAGNHFTNDLAVGLRTSLPEAERIKQEFGAVHESFLKNDLAIDVKPLAVQEPIQVNQADILAILRPRACELFSLIKKEIDNHKLEHLMPAGLVLTGGGSMLMGMKDLAQEIFKVPVRIGHVPICPLMPEILQNPIYATGYGLLKQVVRQKERSLDKISGPAISRILTRMKAWVIDFF